MIIEGGFVIDGMGVLGNYLDVGIIGDIIECIGDLSVYSVKC